MGSVIAAAEATGDLMAVHMGLSGASAVDPLSNISVPVLGQFDFHSGQWLAD